MSRTSGATIAETGHRFSQLSESSPGKTGASFSGDAPVYFRATWTSPV